MAYKKPPSQEVRLERTLRAVRQFAKARNYWPSAAELRRFNRDLGCERTVRLTVSALRHQGLLELLRGGNEAGWMLTPQAYDLLKLPVIIAKPKLSRLARRAGRAQTQARHDARHADERRCSAATVLEFRQAFLSSDPNVVARPTAANGPSIATYE